MYQAMQCREYDAALEAAMAETLKRMSKLQSQRTLQPNSNQWLMQMKRVLCVERQNLLSLKRRQIDNLEHGNSTNQSSIAASHEAHERTLSEETFWGSHGGAGSLLG